MTKELYVTIASEIDSKINYLNNLIADLRSQNNDTKSSMGDKYETSREMMQQEITRIQNQLNEVILQQESFQKIAIKHSDIIVNGSYLETSMGNFVIACSLGEISYDGKKIFVLSSQTPLSKVLLGKKVGETFEMNGKSFLIKKLD